MDGWMDGIYGTVSNYNCSTQQDWDGERQSLLAAPTPPLESWLSTCRTRSSRTVITVKRGWVGLETEECYQRKRNPIHHRTSSMLLCYYPVKIIHDTGIIRYRTSLRGLVPSRSFLLHHSFHFVTLRRQCLDQFIIHPDSL
jgi:hypothetical protein